MMSQSSIYSIVHATGAERDYIHKRQDKIQLPSFWVWVQAHMVRCLRNLDY
jgi:hypothetical protein